MLSLPDFPVENLDKLLRIMNKTYPLDSKHVAQLDKPYSKDYLGTSHLIGKLYPFSVLLKDEETNQKFCKELLNKFDLPAPPPPTASNRIDYELMSIEDSTEGMKQLKFKSLIDSQDTFLAIDLIKGVSGRQKTDMANKFVMNKCHSSQIVDLMLSHSSEHDFCLIGPQGTLFLKHSSVQRRVLIEYFKVPARPS